MELPPFIALELGTTKVRALAGEARDDDHLMILGLGECASRGISKSEIIDFDAALSCARTALHLAEENAGVSIKQVHLLVKGGHVRTLVNRGSIPILNRGGEITRDDVEHVMDTARAVNLPGDQEILHSIGQHFYVDDQGGILNPEGMEGGKLAVDMLMIHGSRTRLRNVVKVVHSVPVDVQDVSFSGLCTALAVLGPEDKTQGALVLDLGGGATDYVAYAGGAIAAAGSISVGGDHVTNDLARGLQVTLPQAERLKEEFGSAVVDLAHRGDHVDLSGEGGAAARSRFVRLGDLQTITSLRQEETFTLIREELERQDLLHHLGSGVFLTGGGAYLNKATVLAERVFNLPCQMGQPRDVSGLAVATDGPEYAAPIGMLRYAIRTARRTQRSSFIAEWIKTLLGRK
jgi:cell division protein FtsA